PPFQIVFISLTPLRPYKRRPIHTQIEIESIAMHTRHRDFDTADAHRLGLLVNFNWPLMSRATDSLDNRHFPFVVKSGSRRSETTASPVVRMGISFMKKEIAHRI